MRDLYVTTIDEEFEKAQVKGFVRTRRGRMERVQPFQRKGDKTEQKAHNQESDKTIFELPNFELPQINSVYVGKPGACMCGCSGKYYYTKDNQKASSKRRGYKVTDDEVSDSKVARVLSKVKRSEENGIEIIKDRATGEPYIFTAIIGKTQYTIYKKNE